MEIFTAAFLWFMMECKDFFWTFSFRLKIEDGRLVSFNGQCVTFRLSVTEL